MSSCLCCGSLGVIPFMYCLSANCTEGWPQYDLMPQTVKLIKMGNGGTSLSNPFVPDEIVIATKVSTNTKSTIKRDVLTVIPNYLEPQWFDETGNMKYAEVYADALVKYPSYSLDLAAFETFGSFAFFVENPSSDAWYKIEFDLGQYGKVYRMLYFAGTNTVKQAIPLPLAGVLFPKYDIPNNNGLVVVNGQQELKHVCCAPCIIEPEKNLVLRMELVGYDMRVNNSYDLVGLCCLQFLGNDQEYIESCHDFVADEPLGHFEEIWTGAQSVYEIPCTWDAMSNRYIGTQKLYHYKHISDMNPIYCAPGGNYCYAEGEVWADIIITCRPAPTWISTNIFNPNEHSTTLFKQIYCFPGLNKPMMFDVDIKTRNTIIPSSNPFCNCTDFRMLGYTCGPVQTPPYQFPLGMGFRVSCCGSRCINSNGPTCGPKIFVPPNSFRNPYVISIMGGTATPLTSCGNVLAELKDDYWGATLPTQRVRLEVRRGD